MSRPGQEVESMLIVITGNRRGLGAALTEELRRRGHRVVGCSSGALEADERVDVSRSDEVDAWAQRVESLHGVPDMLVNNAATVTPLAPLWEQDPEAFGRLLAINVAGVHHTIRAFLPAMIERGSGTVVNISSGWGRTTSPRVAPYCASKWAVEGMTRALAQELPRGLAAVTLDPGTINTDMLKTAFGPAARHFPGAAEWAGSAADMLLSIRVDQNGLALSVPKIESKGSS
jgi:NAD(P)-dependent dehydrogenase (short-subunit alcohol dehydrogenase family)